MSLPATKASTCTSIMLKNLKSTNNFNKEICKNILLEKDPDAQGAINPNNSKPFSDLSFYNVSAKNPATDEQKNIIAASCESKNSVSFISENELLRSQISPLCNDPETNGSNQIERVCKKTLPLAPLQCKENDDVLEAFLLCKKLFDAEKTNSVTDIEDQNYSQEGKENHKILFTHWISEHGQSKKIDTKEL